MILTQVTDWDNEREKTACLNLTWWKLDFCLFGHITRWTKISSGTEFDNSIHSTRNTKELTATHA